MSQAVVVQAFGPSSWEAEAGGQVYKVSYRAAKVIQRNPISINKQMNS